LHGRGTKGGVMKKPYQAISIIKDFCPVSGIEVEGYLNYLENKLYKIAEILEGARNHLTESTFNDPDTAFYEVVEAYKLAKEE
jgi:hypothetical protein